MRKLIITVALAVTTIYGVAHVKYEADKAYWTKVIAENGLKAYHVEGTERHERRYLILTSEGYAFGTPIGEYDKLAVALRRAKKVHFKHHGIRHDGAIGTEVWLPFSEQEARALHKEGK